MTLIAREEDEDNEKSERNERNMYSYIIVVHFCPSRFCPDVFMLPASLSSLLFLLVFYMLSDTNSVSSHEVEALQLYLLGEHAIPSPYMYVL